MESRKELGKSKAAARICIECEEPCWSGERTLAPGEVVQIACVKCTYCLQFKPAMYHAGLEGYCVYKDCPEKYKLTNVRRHPWKVQEDWGKWAHDAHKYNVLK